MLHKILIAVVIASIAYFGYTQFFTKTYISQDTLIQGDYKPDQNKTLVMKNGATLTVEGNATIKNPVECENGSININVKGNLSVSDKFDCQNKDNTSTKGVSGVGIALAVGGNLEFTDNASVSSNGHILLVDSPDHFPKTEEDLEKLFLETGMDTNDGNFRIGPLGTDEENIKEPLEVDQIFKNSNIAPPAKRSGFNLISTAHAADPGDVVLRGKWKINTPPPGVKQILIFFNFPGRSLEINGEMTGPNGADAQDIKGGCFIDIPTKEFEEKEAIKNGKKVDKKYTGNDAFRMRARSKRLVIGNFKLTLGDGGKGGDAETDQCDLAVALAGTGGQSGTMKLTAVDDLIIKDSFTIIPGKGGKGGDAVSYGKKGESSNPGGKGGDAYAAGGQGADNIRNLKALGKVKGLDKIYIGSVIGGDGGNATASPGDGGDGNVCDAKGGPPGEGVAYGGPGGYYGLKLPDGVKDTNDADDRDGEKGKETVNEAKPGKNGPPCDGDSKEEDKSKSSTPSPTPKNIPASAKSSTSTRGLTGQIYFFHGSEGGGSISSSDPSGNASATLISNYPSSLAKEAGGVKWSYYTPLKVELKVGNKLVWQSTINNSSCNDEMSEASCSIDGYKYDPAWDGYTFFMDIYDKNGKLRAHFARKPSQWKPSCSGSDCPPPFIQAPLP